MEKVIFSKVLYKKMTILLQKIEIFQNLPLFLPFCMIEHGFVQIQENDEKSKFIIIVYI